MMYFTGLSFSLHNKLCLLPDFEPDPGAERWKEPNPAGPDATGGSGAKPLRRPGSGRHTWQCLHTNLPLQASIFLLLVIRCSAEIWEKTFAKAFSVLHTKRARFMLESGYIFLSRNKVTENSKTVKKKKHCEHLCYLPIPFWNQLVSRHWIWRDYGFVGG